MAAREYSTRVRRKSFLITTLLVPLLFIGMMVLPAVIASMSTPSERHIAVVDQSGNIARRFPRVQGLDLTLSTIPVDSLKADEQYDGVLIIPADIVEKPAGAVLYTHDRGQVQTQSMVEGLLSQAVVQARLEKYDVPQLPQILEDSRTQVQVDSIFIDGDEEQVSSAATNVMMGIALGMILYMIILIYGQMVMNSIIEEKNNRVLEIVVSSMRPFSIMLGKILGIGAVALTQVAIWLVLIGAFAQWGLPAVAGESTDMSGIVSTLGDSAHLLGIFAWLLAFLTFGFLFYASIYAAVGSAVDNVQDASQLQTLAAVPIIIAMVFIFTVLEDPMSSTATWLSMIPFTSPVVMMCRLPFGVPVWETASSLVILAASTMFMVWLAGKIYRVGIFMYGKKPGIKELLRWARYK